MDGKQRTSGPWSAFEGENKRSPIEIRTSQPIYDGALQGVEICKISHSTINARANAAFIVLACNQHDDLVQQRDELAGLLRRSLKVIDALMPGVKYIAVQNYKELNDVPVDAERTLEKVTP